MGCAGPVPVRRRLAGAACRSLVLWSCVKLAHDRRSICTSCRWRSTFQWSQTSLGVFYKGLSPAARCPPSRRSDYRPMVLIGLGCVLALAAGIKLGLMAAQTARPRGAAPRLRVPLRAARSSLYVVERVHRGLAARDRPVLPVAASDHHHPGHGAARRAVSHHAPAVQPDAALGHAGGGGGVEVIMGITGFFAGFREPIVLAVLAVLEMFDRRTRSIGSPSTVAIVGVSVARAGLDGHPQATTAVSTSKSTSSRTSRSTRVQRVGDLTSAFFKSDPTEVWGTADSLVDRMWTIYYPALAVRTGAERPAAHQRRHPQRRTDTHRHAARVLSGQARADVRQREGPQILQHARRRARNRTPASRSAMLPRPTSTSAMPLMFVPVFGVRPLPRRDVPLFRSIIWHRELFVAFATVAFWLSALPLRALVGDDARRHRRLHGLPGAADDLARPLPAGPHREGPGETLEPS